MKQVTFAFEHDEVNHRGPPLEAERERQLIELMAQAIAAVLQHTQGEEDEPSLRIPDQRDRGFRTNVTEYSGAT